MKPEHVQSPANMPEPLADTRRFVCDGTRKREGEGQLRIVAIRNGSDRRMRISKKFDRAM